MINDRRSRLMEDELVAVRETLSEIKKSQWEEGTLAALDNSLSSNAGPTNSKRHVYAEVHFDDQKTDYIQNCL
ncbi:unnamed protein product [Allacma fusca]|uniref:Uncharacterized protein n=1 Tax=Allacma fusca TaxID=39272 RepID=A0A8J2L820_9HEXA|nr:unnamed protein product [Allacma fusca]